MTDPRPSWEDYFLTIAQAVAARADCTRRQVGAVLVRGNRVVSTGYNGAESGQPGCLTSGACPRGRAAYGEIAPRTNYSNCIAIHAEVNALIGMGDVSDCTLYVTHEPCHQCWAYIAATDLKGVVWTKSKEDDPCFAEN